MQSASRTRLQVRRAWGVLSKRQKLRLAWWLLRDLVWLEADDALIEELLREDVLALLQVTRTHTHMHTRANTRSHTRTHTFTHTRTHTHTYEELLTEAVLALLQVARMVLVAV